MTTNNTLPGRLEAQEGTDSRGWADNLHVGALIFGGVSTILIALRLISVAKANPETAYGILQAGTVAEQRLVEGAQAVCVVS